jgi:YD repeat-containing protein
MNRKFPLLLLGGVLSLPAWAIQYQYDELHRLTRVQYDNGASIDYGYDPAGNIVSIAKIAGSSSVPGVPTITRIIGGNGLLKIYFTPPAVMGGEAITEYMASCVPVGGGATVTGSTTGSPAVVSGLENRTSYTCTLHASSAGGSGSESSAGTGQAGPPNLLPILTVILQH